MTAPRYPSRGCTPAIPGLRRVTRTPVEGSAFCTTQTSGAILPGEPLALLVQDTRVVSRWSLTIDGRPAEPLAVQQARPYAAAFTGCLRPPRGAPSDAAMPIARHRSIGDRTREHISIRSVPCHARAASGGPRGDGGPGRAADTPPGHEQLGGGS